MSCFHLHRIRYFVNFTVNITYIYIHKLYTETDIGKAHAITCHEGAHRGVQVQLCSFFNLGTSWGGWLTLRPSRFTPGNNTGHIVLGGTQ